MSSTTKRTHKHAPVPTPKQRAFARAYLETGEATAAYHTAYNTENMKQTTVHQEAHQTLKIPAVKIEVERLFAQNEIHIENVLAIHKRNIEQDEHLPTSQRAVETYYDVIGLKTNNTQTPNMQVAFIIHGSTDTKLVGHNNKDSASNSVATPPVSREVREGVEEEIN